VAEELQENRIKKFTVINPESLLSELVTNKYLKSNQPLMFKTSFDEYMIVNER